MLSKEDILSIVASELSSADYSSYHDSGITSLEDALRYYLGGPNGTEVEGRSKVVSTDVADCIEWILPQIMESFTQNNEIVIFDPISEGDEKQAELESQYVYEILMKQNDGFIILHQFIKDALMQRNGILKVYYSEKTETKSVEYTGITEEQLTYLLSQEGVELVEQSEYIDENQTRVKQESIQAQLQQVMQQMQPGQPPNPQMQQAIMGLEEELQKPVILYDVRVGVSRIRGKIYVDPVPPEEFRVNARHNSISLENARFTAHVTMKTVSDIIEEYGISFDETKELPEGCTYYEREYRFNLQEGSVFYDSSDSEDESQREIEVAECFMKIDIDETGIAKLMKITVAGGDTPTDILSVEEIECMPWVSTTTFLMSHKFQGLSITDRLKQLQDQKTALWRNMLDNLYLQNNQRHIVIENQVNMDDMLISRPGGMVRAKRPDAVTPLITPQIGQEAYTMMEYLDRVRSGRVGVDPDGPATPQNIGDRVGSEGVDRLMNAKEALVGLIIRVIAETGIKPLCFKLRDLSIKHVDSVVDFKFRGVWQQIMPSEWPDRTTCTVRVGTGTGDRNQQINTVGQIIQIQERIIQQPGQSLVTEGQVFKALDDLCKFAGLNGASKYFLDPDSPDGQQNKQQVSQSQQAAQQKEEQMQMVMAQMQAKLAEAEVQKANAQLANAQTKAEVETTKNQLTHMKQQYEAQISAMKQELEENRAIVQGIQKDKELEFKYYQQDQATALELTRIEATSKTDENENFVENKGAVNE